LWAKRKSNLVLLTAKEHLKSHELLAKIYGGKMWFAYNRLATDKKDGHKLSLEKYEELQIMYSKACSERNIELFKNPEQRKNRGRSGKLNGNYGNFWTNEQKEHLSKKLKGKQKPHSEEWERNRIKAMREYYNKNSNIKRSVRIINKVINLTTKEIFNNHREASQKYEGNILNSCKNKGKTKNNFWAFYSENMNIEEELKLRIEKFKKSKSRKHSKETLEKISKRLKGRIGTHTQKHSEESKQKMRESRLKYLNKLNNNWETS
jgi:hypothetical protein